MAFGKKIMAVPAPVSKAENQILMDIVGVRTHVQGERMMKIVIAYARKEHVSIPVKENA
jgi:hypothetical protein